MGISATSRCHIEEGSAVIATPNKTTVCLRQGVRSNRDLVELALAVCDDIASGAVSHAVGGKLVLAVANVINATREANRFGRVMGESVGVDFKPDQSE